MNSEPAVWYPNEADIGIDEGTRARLATTILDFSIHIPPSGRPNTVNYNQWDKESATAYGQWLCAVLGYSQETTGPPNEEMFSRASKLGLGPSYTTLVRIEGIDNFPNYQRLIDFIPKRGFGDWTKADYIREGLRLTQEHGRLTGRKLDELYRQGLFPAKLATKNRFGSLRNFHELTGKPSTKGWMEDDHIDWGIAVLDQNPNIVITTSVLEKLSARKVGPSDLTVRNMFGGIQEFRERVIVEREERQKEEYDRARERRAEIKLALENDELPEGLLTDVTEDEQSRVYGLYKVAVALVPDVEPARVLKVVRADDPEEAAVKITKLRPSLDLSVGDIEIQAEDMDLYDDIWPMRRFQNVDLRLAA